MNPLRAQGNPGAVAARSTTLTVTIMAIDTEIPSVTFTGPGSNTRTIHVMHPRSSSA